MTKNDCVDIYLFHSDIYVYSSMREHTSGNRDFMYLFFCVCVLKQNARNNNICPVLLFKKKYFIIFFHLFYRFLRGILAFVILNSKNCNFTNINIFSLFFFFIHKMYTLNNFNGKIFVRIENSTRGRY